MTFEARAVLRVAAGALVVLLLFAGTFVWWFWQPLHVLERTQSKLEREVERRNWEKVRSLLSADYSDSWGQTREAAIESGQEVMRHFFVLGVENRGEDQLTQLDDGGVLLRRKLALQGSGSAIAAMIMERVNGQPGAFLFTWQREHGWPPSWKLRALAHEDAENLR